MVGSKHAHILISTVVEDWEACTLRGQKAIDLFPQIYDALESVVGTEGASILALPEQSFSKTRQARVVTWYTDQAGSFRPFDALSDDERAIVEGLLRRRLHNAIEHADNQLGELLAVALNLPSPDGVFFNGETIVLANWGFVRGVEDGNVDGAPSGALSPFLPAGFSLIQHLSDEDLNAGDAGYEEEKALGSLPLAPPVGTVPFGGQSDHVSGTGQSNQVPAVGAHVAATSQPQNLLLSGNADTSWRGATAWLSGLALMLVILLVYLLWPGSLLYPSRDLGPLGQDQAREAERDNQDAIRGQIGRLQAAIVGNVCTAADAQALDGIAGLPVLPEFGRTNADRPNGVVQPPVDGPGQEGAPDPSPAVVEPLQSGDSTVGDTPASPSSTALDSHELIEKLDNGTVLVVSMKAGGTDIGSGFFITPQRVLTNFHVVEGNDTGRILVANRHLPSPVAARVIARSASSQASSQDFALLELEQPVNLTPLPLSIAVDRLDGVIAGGFPRAVIDSDPNFAAAMREGRAENLSRVQMAVTRGEVTTLQPGQNGTTVVVHSATISFGNSGGPLIDRCGRVVGINTYLRTNSVDSSMRLNAALSTKDILEFLRANGATAQAASNRCTENARSAAPSQTAQPTGQPVAPAQAPATAPASPPSAVNANPSATTPDPISPSQAGARPQGPAEGSSEADMLIGPSNGASR